MQELYVNVVHVFHALVRVIPPGASIFLPPSKNICYINSLVTALDQGSDLDVEFVRRGLHGGRSLAPQGWIKCRENDSPRGTRCDYIRWMSLLLLLLLLL